MKILLAIGGVIYDELEINIQLTGIHALLIRSETKKTGTKISRNNIEHILNYE